MSIEPLPEDEPCPDSEPPFISIYLASTRTLIARLTRALDKLRLAPSDTGALEELHRGFHSLHGNSSFLPRCPITPLARAGEEALMAARRARVEALDLAPLLGDALDRCSARLDEYHRYGVAGSAAPREQEIAAALGALARRSVGVDPAPATGPRYIYGGEDVTATLEILAQHDAAQGSHGLVGAGDGKLARAQEQLRDRAAAIGDHELLELLDRRGAHPGDPRALFRLLAQRVRRDDEDSAR